MSSNAITEKQPDQSPPDSWRSGEIAPSIMRQDEPTVARWVGWFGLLLAVVGGVAYGMHLYGRAVFLSPNMAVLFLALGVGGLLFHAVAERDTQIRRLYGGVGAVLLVAGAILSWIYANGAWGGLFLYGFLSLTLALLFLLAFLRNETETQFHDLATYALGGAGAAMALIALVGSFIWGANLLLPFGFLLAILGLFYLSAFVSVRGISDDLGYKVGLGMGAIGLLAFVAALILSTVVPLFSTATVTKPLLPFIPTGLLLMGLGLVYAAQSASFCSDNTFIVMTRRELAAFFYSPVAYLVLLGLALGAWWFYIQFLGRLILISSRGVPLEEPIIRLYVFDLGPVIFMVAIVPFLTMRLVSEEKRSGTLEVLLTAPVTETTIVLSKFIAALLFYLVSWLPWGLFLVDFRIEGGQPFDYRPLLSFFVVLTFLGANFIGMGLFFSSLVKNQIGAAVFTFAGMLFWFFLGLMELNMEGGGAQAQSGWATVLTHVSFIKLWWDALEGALVFKFLLFHASMAVFWLFLTVKVLEARKWS